MSAYYNELDPFCAQWLRNLIAAGHLPDGYVDERSILEVRASDLFAFDQCHFFAGIGGWPLALSMAGWPDEREAWTGSCPCQPFSSSGKGAELEDDRHLWPAWFALIRQCRPAIIFGEQVASPLALAWFDHVAADLETAQYAVAAADLCAAGVGAPHVRQRLWFVADSKSGGLEERQRTESVWQDQHGPDAQRCGARSVLGDAPGEGLQARQIHAGGASQASGASAWEKFERAGGRRIKPGLEPLADGIPGRVGRLRAYGNAIVPQVAAEFVKAVMECRP